ncbi:hypothetical protein PC110_g8649 [Phytophthora cactorum]|uniref:Uncharacterized protein n=1 Tax=Phytophthora cactorum TaxID=29920 RepID=A0A329SE46_9STRA|nr:hypothetical protein PC110_g8649 [Phytophthora cactorum]
MTESTVQLELGGPGVSLDGLGAGIVQLDAALEEAETQDSVVSPTAQEARSSGSRRTGAGRRREGRAGVIQHGRRLRFRLEDAHASLRRHPWRGQRSSGTGQLFLHLGVHEEAAGAAGLGDTAPRRRKYVWRHVLVVSRGVVDAPMFPE